MSLRATLRCWWRAVIHRGRVAAEAEAELRFHEEVYAADLVRQGVAPREAARRARVELGPPETHGERYRTVVGLRGFDELGGDFRFGLRSLLRNPGYSAVIVLSLALGIGAATAMFSLIYAVLLHPFPYAGADRIMNPVIVNEEAPSQAWWFPLWKSQFDEFAKAPGIESLLGFNNKSLVLLGNGLPQDVYAVYLTENAAQFFGIRPVLGRMIEPSDAALGGQPVAVLNYRFWQQHFHGAQDVIGKPLELDHTVYSIVGVMPRSFAFDDSTGVGDVYLPATLMTRETVTEPESFIPWLKLKRGVTVAEANAQLNALVHAFAQENPGRFPKRFHLALQPIVVPYEQSTGKALVLLLVGVLVLLLIGCGNGSILFLARGTARRQELAVRCALGASRWRIARQLLVEAMTISAVGAALGVAASYWLARVSLEMESSIFPAEAVIRVNLPILGFSVGLALLSGLLFGLAPALRLSRADAAHSLRGGRRIAGADAGRPLQMLIAVQIALTLLLLATAGMAAEGFLQVIHAPLGYQPRNVMGTEIHMHWENAKDWSAISRQEKRVAFVERVRQKIAAVPGVLSVAVGNDATPPDSGLDYLAFQLEGSPAESDGQPKPLIEFVSREYFATLHIPLLRGRVWDEAENARGDAVAVVNAAFAREYLSGSAGVVRKVRIPELEAHGPLMAASAQSAGWRQIIGVVGDARDEGVDRPVIPAIYLPYSTWLGPYAEYEIQTRGEPMAYLNAIQAAVASVQADQQLSHSDDLEELIRKDSLWSRGRLFSILFGFFSGLALLLALVGLFSMVAWSVTERTAEFGVRLALGASRGHIVWVAARRAAMGVVLGTMAGGAADFVLGRSLATWMNTWSCGWGSTVEAVLLLLLCSTIACWLAARRAGGLHPTEALRYE